MDGTPKRKIDDIDSNSAKKVRSNVEAVEGKQEGTSGPMNTGVVDLQKTFECLENCVSATHKVAEFSGYTAVKMSKTADHLKSRMENYLAIFPMEPELAAKEAENEEKMSLENSYKKYCLSELKRREDINTLKPENEVQRTIEQFVEQNESRNWKNDEQWVKGYLMSCKAFQTKEGNTMYAKWYEEILKEVDEVIVQDVVCLVEKKLFKNMELAWLWNIFNISIDDNDSEDCRDEDLQDIGPLMELTNEPPKEESEMTPEIFLNKIDAYTMRQELLRTGQCSDADIGVLSPIEIQMGVVYESSNGEYDVEDSVINQNLFFKRAGEKMRGVGRMTDSMCDGLLLLSFVESPIIMWDALFLSFLEKGNESDFEKTMESYALSIFS